MYIETLHQILTQTQIEIVKAVSYFDVFKYPLTIDELYENSSIRVSKETFLAELELLLDMNIVKKKDTYILSIVSGEAEIMKRHHGNKGAHSIMPLAYKYSRKIARFPFVEGVCLSGGLSKNYYDQNSDIDFFIITKPNRLWICRTLLILRYKLLPASKKKYWCTNYFISSNDLSIPDRNAFTSTELAYLIPTVNYSVYQKLIHGNMWYKEKFPNKPAAPNVNCLHEQKYFLKTITEALLGGAFGKWLDNRLLFYTLNHWRKRYHELSSEDFELQFRARKSVCKRHTKGFQNKVLKSWEDRKSEFESSFGISLR